MELAESVDTLLGELIDEVSSDVTEYLGRPLAYQQYEEKFRGNGENYLQFSRWPLDGDSSRITVTIDGTADTDWEVADFGAGILYRDSTWVKDNEFSTVVTYYAGYLMPGQVSAWATGAKVLGQFVSPTVSTSSSFAAVSPLVYEATTAGTSAGTEPTWPMTLGGTVTDGTAVWTARSITPIPAWLSALVLAEVRDRYYKRLERSDVSAIREGSFSETYNIDVLEPNTSSGLPVLMERALGRLRAAA